MLVPWRVFHLTFGLILIDVSYGYLLITSNSQVADGSEGKLVAKIHQPHCVSGIGIMNLLYSFYRGGVKSVA